MNALPESLPSATSVPALVIPVQPIPGEGIPELLQRAAAVNGYRNVVDVMRIADPGWGVPASAGTSVIGRESMLARALGIVGGVEEIERLAYRSVPARTGWHDFFGTPLRRVHREVRYRRVSPRALRASPHGRAVWSVKLLGFDPSTRERLLEECPGCGHRLTFRTTLGIEYCDCCLTSDRYGMPIGAVDLRDLTQPLVEVGDEEALDFAAALLDPLQDARRFLPAGSPFGSVEPGDMFEFVYAVACTIVAANAGRSSSWRAKSHAEFSSVGPDVLAEAGRVALGWPSSFHDLGERLRAARVDRPLYFGVAKELGPITDLSVDPNLSKEIRYLVQTAVRANMAASAFEPGLVRRSENRHRSDLVTMQEAHKRFGFNRRRWADLAADPRAGVVRAPGASKAPVLLPLENVRTIVEEARDLQSASDLGARWGVPTWEVELLSRHGHVTAARGPGVLLLGKGTFYTGASVQAAETALSALVMAGIPTADTVTLGAAADAFRRELGQPLISIASAVLCGDIEAWQGTDGGILSGLLVSASLAPANINVRHSRTREVGLTQGEAAALLHASAVTVSELVAAGLLAPPLTLSGLETFSRRFALTTEVHMMDGARTRGLRLRDVPGYLQSRGIAPCHEFGSRGKLLWERETVTCVLAADRNTADRTASHAAD
ncbi:hypothetical protein [Aureimonas jatrophae]|uniref:TniQ protein n=1 Tax=Aureimonas jatrophae TaxID=1166073 RepID=A0A1H0LGG7_9HYPH|nr:hypothetical protein [Aureimonas jatrophae]MBB3952504.1 hypothetical protein [Aureimonas jatrophae]SDO67101.1 hypothetical protein SAMN05192530_11021 [Aureimonas jatrophae]